jgi:hypothetical protein
MQLSKFDDYPLHQTASPVSCIPSTDFAWDEGYYFSVYSAQARVFLLTGMRITPNADVIGGYAALNLNGRQRSLRLSRIWSNDRDLQIGPLGYRIVEPFRDIHLRLEENESGMSWDVHWLGSGPAHLSSHHLATNRGRRVTDQTRYNQAGRAAGWIQSDGQRFAVDTARWHGARDHSWGLYEPRPPLSAPLARFLPPPQALTVRRALRLSIFFATDSLSGHFHLHEDEEGRQMVTNDAFGIPFEGAVDLGWTSRTRFTSARHELKFKPGTRSVEEGTIHIEDENGGSWTLFFQVSAPPAVILLAGYHVGSWKDGGNIHTYHGPANPYLEWDEFDFSRQPCAHVFYGETEPRQVFGAEHLARLRCVAPDGSVSHGEAHVEIFLNGRYSPYGFEAQRSTDHGLTGRAIL